MTTRVAQPLVDGYLDRLYAAAQQLPADARDDLVAEIEAHLSATLPNDATRAEVRLALARLGSPEEIVAEAIPPLPRRVVRRGVQEWLAIVALLLGGVVVPFVGWTVGLVMLWSSQTWRAIDKVVGTVLFPGGLAVAGVLVLYGRTSTGTECGRYLVKTNGHRHLTPYACHATPAPGFHTGLLQAIVIFTALPLLGALYLALRARPHTVRAYPEGATWVERRGPRETLAIVLLLFGGLVLPVVGWIAGVWLLWTSRAWDRRDRLAGTLLIPGGLAIPIAYMVSTVHIGGGADSKSGFSSSVSILEAIAWVTLMIAAFVVPVATAIYLSRHARAHEVHSRFGR